MDISSLHNVLLVEPKSPCPFTVTAIDPEQLSTCLRVLRACMTRLCEGNRARISLGVS
jgi:hypothetical protein